MPKAKQTDKPRGDSQTELVAAAVKRFDDWDNYAEPYRKVFNRDWKLTHNKRVSRAYKGVSDTFVPMAHGVKETMAAALGNGRPAIDYAPEYPLDDFDAKPLNALVDCYWDSGQWDVRTYQAICQLLEQGNTPNYFSWGLNRPEWTNIGLEDFFFSPALSSPRQWLDGEGYAGRRFITSVDKLSEFQVVDSDPNSKTYGQMKPRFKSLSRLKDMSPSDWQKTDKAVKEDFMGSTMPMDTKGLACVYEIWDNDYVTSVANRKVLIERVENPHKVQHRLLLEQQYLQEALQKAAEDPLADLDQVTAEAKTRAAAEARGLIPFAMGRDYIDLSLMYARSEVDPIAGEQETLNDMTNQNVDAVTWQLLPERHIDPKYASWIGKIGQAKPGRILPIPKTALEYADPPVIPSNAFNERQNIKNEIREATAVDQVAKGVSDETNPTATQVRAQLNQAGQRIEIKARMLEKDFFYQVGYILWRLIQLYVTEPVDVTIQTDGGAEQAKFDPGLYRGLKLMPKVTLEITAQQKREKERGDALQAYELLSLDPNINLQELQRLLLPKMFDLESQQIDKLLTPVMQPGMLGGVPPAPGAMPPMPNAQLSPQGAEAPA